MPWLLFTSLYIAFQPLCGTEYNRSCSIQAPDPNRENQIGSPPKSWSLSVGWLHSEKDQPWLRGMSRHSMRLEFLAAPDSDPRFASQPPFLAVFWESYMARSGLGCTLQNCRPSRPSHLQANDCKKRPSTGASDLATLVDRNGDVEGPPPGLGWSSWSWMEGQHGSSLVVPVTNNR